MGEIINKCVETAKEQKKLPKHYLSIYIIQTNTVMLYYAKLININRNRANECQNGAEGN